MLLLKLRLVIYRRPKLFAADSVAAPGNLSQTIYSLAQCWRDLSQTSCGSCLTEALSNIFRCQSGEIGAQFGSKNCYLRYEVYEFFNTYVLSPPPGKSPSVSSGGKISNVLGIILGVVAAIVGLIAAIGLWKWKHSSRRKCRERIYLVRGDQGEISLAPSITNTELIFKYDFLREATSNFKLENKGVFPDHREVAVKRLYISSRQGDAEFLNEENLISRVQESCEIAWLLR